LGAKFLLVAFNHWKKPGKIFPSLVVKAESLDPKGSQLLQQASKGSS
jgi:hypothetical protein